MKNSCLLQAHRGVSTERPENTLAAFRLAAEQGYGLIEADPKFTADGRCVILHDRTLNRTCRHADGSPLEAETPIASLTLEQAREYDAGLWFGEAFRGEKIPTLEELLAFSAESGVPVKLDNVWESFDASQRERFFDVLTRCGREELTALTCANPDNALEAARRFPRSAVHFDGYVDEAVLERLHSEIPPERLTVWLRYDNRATAWNKNPPADERSAALVKRYGRLGLWILSQQSEFEDAVGRLHADVVETTGSIKPAR